MELPPGTLESLALFCVPNLRSALNPWGNHSGPLPSQWLFLGYDLLCCPIHIRLSGDATWNVASFALPLQRNTLISRYRLQVQ